MNEHPKPDFATPSSFVTFRLARLQNSLNAQAVAVLKSRSDLSLVEWRLIQSLRIFENASLTKLATVVEMDKGQMSRKINAMVKKGLLRIERDDRDQRVQHLHLTDTARAISRKLMPTMEARQKTLLAEVSPEDLSVFYKVVEKIEAASKVRDIT